MTHNIDTNMMIKVLFITFFINFSLLYVAKAQSFYEFNMKIEENELPFKVIDTYNFEIPLPNHKTLVISRLDSIRVSKIKLKEGKKGIVLDFLLEARFFFRASWLFSSTNLGDLLILENYFPRAQGLAASIVNISIVSFDEENDLYKMTSFNTFRGDAKNIHTKDQKIVIDIFKHYIGTSDIPDCLYLYEFELQNNFTLKPIKASKPRFYEPWYGNLRVSNSCENIIESHLVENKYVLESPYVLDPLKCRDIGSWGDSSEWRKNE